MNIIFIAPPAAGKGTVSKYLVENFNYEHISTGDLLRNIVKEDSILASNIKKLMADGKFISDDLMLELIKKKLISIDSKLFILDGMPRNLFQAESLEKLFQELNVDNYLVIHMDVKEEILEKRIVGRKVCLNCGASYNIYFDEFKPKNENICNHCNKDLVNREDDSLETFKNRYSIFVNETLPLVDFYKKKNCLKTVDASGTEEEIIKKIISIIKGVKND